MAHGIRVCVLIFSLFALLTGLLIWLRIPRPLVFAILYASAGIHVASYFAAGWMLYALNRDLLDGFLPYVLPILPLVSVHRVDTSQTLQSSGPRTHSRSNQSMKPTAHFVRVQIL